MAILHFPDGKHGYIEARNVSLEERIASALSHPQGYFHVRKGFGWSTDYIVGYIECIETDGKMDKRIGYLKNNPKKFCAFCGEEHG